MSRYIVDSKKDLLAYEQLIWTPLRCLEDADKAIDDAYQRGLEDGKKAANDKGCEGCEYSDGVVQENSPCANCCNYYTNNWTKKEFVRGDVVVDEDGTRGIVVSSENNESNLLYVLFDGYRTPQSVVQKHYKKTGKHYDIDKFLDEIKGDGDK